MDQLIRIALSLVIIGVLIIVHEYGHFLVARWAGVRVLRFSVGFGPRLFTRKRGETEYRLSLFPLGGYVKMAGEQRAEAQAKPWEYLSKPVGTRAHIQVCGTTPCMLRGSEELMEVCRKKIHPEPFHLNDSGTLSWEEVECQGACVNAPMVMIFKDSYEDLTPERLAYIIDRFEAGRPEEINTGPQINRIYSAPESGLTSLTKEIKVPAGGAAKGTKGKSKSPEATEAARPKSKSTTPASKSPAKAKADVKDDAKTPETDPPKTVSKAPLARSSS